MPWPTADIEGRRGFKLVPGRFPPMRHFQRIADARDLDTLDAIEAMTDDHARDEIGQIELVPAHQRLSSSHAKPLMAAFTTFSPNGGLFSDGSYGVFCLQLREDSAISEARRDISAFLAATKEKPIKLRLSLYSIGLAGDVADLRKVDGIRWEHLTSDGWIESRMLGKRLRAAGMAGALYPNARAHETDNLVLFNTSALTDCVHYACVELNWNGRAIDTVTVVPGTEVSA